jgi:hypothetical protein
LSNPRSALACRTGCDRTSGATSILHHFPYTNLTVHRLVSAAQKLRTLFLTDAYGPKRDANSFRAYDVPFTQHSIAIDDGIQPKKASVSLT